MADKILVPTRNELIRQYERDYQLRVPGARVGEGTLPGNDARVFVDQLLPLYAEAAAISGAQDLENLFEAELEDEAADLGLARRLPPAGASGSVDITASIGGALILAGQRLTNRITGKRYQCIATGLYTTGDPVPVAGVDTGPDTNVDPGVVLDWSSPPPGLSPTAIVIEQSGEAGLTGGRLEETDPEIRDRIRAERASPALAGNSAEYRQVAAETPNLAVAAAFTYPAVLGPGTMGLAFTMRPSASGASRRPNGAQISAVRAHVVGQMPEDDSLFVYALLADVVDVDLRVRWKRGAVGWADVTPWPLYNASDPVYVTAATDATHFSVATTAVSPAPPRAGGTIGFFDATERKFVQKRILSFTGVGSLGSPWVIVCDTAASDTAYVPLVNQRPMPWSDSLAGLVPPLLAEFDKLGPGDHVTFDTGGLRKRREPSGYTAYPAELSGRILTPLYALGSVDDVQAASPSLPHAPPPGTPGVNAYIIELGKLRVFPL